MADQPKIVIEKTSDGIAWTDPTGKRQEFCRPIRTLWLNVQNLRSTCSIRKEDVSSLQTALMGTALVEDYGLQVIGFPATKTKSVDLGFHPYSKEEADRIAANAQEPFTTVSVGHMTSDWEIGNKDGWYCSVYLPADQLQRLAQAFQAGSIASMVIGVSLTHNAYVTTGDSYAPPSCKVQWYFSPSSGSDQASVNAGGELSFINYHTPEINLVPAPTPDSDPEIPAFQSPPDPLHAKLDATVAQLAGIRSSLKLIGWAIVALAGIALFK